MGHSDILSPHIWQVPCPHKNIIFFSLSRHTGHMVCSLMSASCCWSFWTSLIMVGLPASLAPLFMRPSFWTTPPPPPLMLLTVWPTTAMGPPWPWDIGGPALFWTTPPTPWPWPPWPPCPNPPAAPSGTALMLTTFLSLLAEKEKNLIIKDMMKWMDTMSSKSNNTPLFLEFTFRNNS